ncbi:MAG: thrombospondin type 3 repeat-containing protein [Gammaproteobacteria bacterium]
MLVSSYMRVALLTLLVFNSFQTPALDTASADNEVPVAHAGEGRSVVIGEVVTLDASGSTDRNGDRLNFHWILRTPPGSGAQLSDATALQPHFIVDLLGDYFAELVVDDGKVNSVAKAVTMSTGNVAPVAVVSSGDTFGLGESFVLDASSSFDFNRDSLSYSWSLVEAPAGSRSRLNATRSAAPHFLPDVAGEYVIELVVSDGRLSSEPALVRLHTEEKQLQADAGPDRRTYTGTSIQLRSDASSQEIDTSLNYQWHILHAPAGSNAQLNSAKSATASFRADVAGQYLVQLMTSSDEQSSAPNTMLISAYERSPSMLTASRQGGSDVDGDGVPDDIDNCAEQANPSQLDTNGDGFGNRCDADIDNDGFITNFGDLVLWVDSFGSTPGMPNWNPDADFNGDNSVNFIDLFIFQGFFLTAPGPIVNRFINPLGGTWHDPANWSLGVVPLSTHSARIDLDPGVTVEYSMDSNEIDTLRSTTELLFTGGDLTVNGVMQVEAPVSLSGSGKITDATILTPTTPDQFTVLQGTNFRFENVTLGANVTIENGAVLNIDNDLTLAGSTITLSAVGNNTYLRFFGLSGPSSTLGGTGDVVFGGEVNDNSTRNNIEVSNSTDGLVIGPDVTVRSGTSGGRIRHRISNGPITIQGTVVSEFAGGTVAFDASPLRLEGSFQTSNSAIMDAFFRNDGGSIASSATLDANTGGELQLRGDWISDGAISVSDGTLDIGNTLTAEWDNNGTITISNTTLELGGLFSVADIGTVTGTGTTVINGVLDNTGVTLDAGVDLPGTSLVLGSGGVVLGGSVVNTPLTVPTSTDFTFDNVTLAADVTIENGGNLRVNDDLTLAGSVITIASGTITTYLRFIGVTGDSSTLGGTGEVVFGGTSTSDTRSNIEVFNSLDGLVIGPDVTIRSGTGVGRIRHRFNNGPITVQGTVISELAGRTVSIDADTLSIEGSLQVSNTAILDAIFRGDDGTITASALLSAETGGELQLRGSWTNSGTISVSDATLDIGNTLTAEWDNNGTITLNNATLELGGLFTAADIGTVTGTGSVIIDGVLDNTGTSLDVAADVPGTNVVFASGGVVLGGTIENTPLTIQESTSVTLENVTLATDVLIENGGSLFVNDDLTLAGATITIASTSASTFLRFRGESGASSTLGGTGDVVFGGTTTSDSRNNVEVYNSTDGLIVGAGVTIRTGATGGRIRHRFNNGPVTIQGTVLSDLSGRTFSIDADGLSIEGALQASNSAVLDAFFRGPDGDIAASAMLSSQSGGELQLRGTWVNDGSMIATDATLDLGGNLTDSWQNNGTITLNNATLELGGSYTRADVGTVTGTGVVLLTGTLDNSGMSLDISTDLPGTSVELSTGGVILGGSLVNTPLTVPTSVSFTLENVTLGTDLTVENNATLFINDDLTLAGSTITLATSGDLTYLRFRGESGDSSTLGGTGEVVFGGNSAIDNRNTIEAYNSTDGLVIGPNITVRSDSAAGRIRHRFNNGPITIQGTVISDLADSTVLIDGPTVAIEGELQASNTALLDVFFRSDVGIITATAMLTASPGSEIQLRGDWVNSGVISVTDATLDIGTLLTEQWDNNGTINLNNGALELGGEFTTADIGTLTGTGTILLNGILDNSGMILDFDAVLPGTSVSLGQGGSILGGSIVNTPLTCVALATFTLDNITLGADLIIENGGDIRVIDSLTLAGSTITLAGTANTTDLRFLGESNGTSTLDGTGEVVFGGSTLSDTRNNLEVFNTTGALEIGSGVTIRTGTTGGRIRHRFSNGPITIQGTVISELADRVVTIEGVGLTIDGSLNVGAGSFIEFGDDYTLSATAAVNIDVGGTDPADFGHIDATTSEATLDGALNINLVNGFSPSIADTFAFMEFSTRNGTFGSENGTVIGGGLSFDVSYGATDVTLEVVN